MLNRYAETGMIELQEAVNVTGIPDEEAEKKFAGAILGRFNEIAGGADVTSGPKGRTVYFLNEEHTEYILFTVSNIYYISLDENGHKMDDIRYFNYLVIREDGVRVCD